MFTIMIRQPLKMFALACAAVFAFGTMAEAAPRKVLHHRAKHSARVSSSTSAIAAKKAAHRRRARKAARPVVHHHRPSTKPR